MGTGKLPTFAAAVALVVFSGTAALAGVHTWDVNEAFTNATGTIQFIELKEAQGLNNEGGISGQSVISNQSSFAIPSGSNVAGTANKHLLFATAAFAALPGAPVPNFIIPSNFFSTTLGNNIRFGGIDTNFIWAGAPPTNGVTSLNEVAPQSAAAPIPGVNSPCNYAGVCGSVDASVHPAAVPDGDGPTVPMTVRRMDIPGSTLRIFWDTASCSPNGSFQIIYGEGSDLPSVLGGTFGLLGSVCTVGGSPYQWTSVPAAGDGSGLLWWLMTIRDTGGKEGSWGHDITNAERVGPGPGGSSGMCGVTAKDVTNLCGQ